MTKKLFLLLLCLLSAGCFDQKDFLQKIVPKNDDLFARHFIEVVRTGDYETAKKMSAPAIIDEKTEGVFRHFLN